eukprot:Nk52_evm31s1569 gene=Nk52_evmTU31s1569
MGVKCSYGGCRSNYVPTKKFPEKQPSVPIHKYPGPGGPDCEKRSPEDWAHVKRWYSAFNRKWDEEAERKEWDEGYTTVHWVACDDHFLDCDFKRANDGKEKQRRQLLPNAIPRSEIEIARVKEDMKLGRGKKDYEGAHRRLVLKIRDELNEVLENLNSIPANREHGDSDCKGERNYPSFLEMIKEQVELFTLLREQIELSLKLPTGREYRCKNSPSGVKEEFDKTFSLGNELHESNHLFKWIHKKGMLILPSRKVFDEYRKSSKGPVPATDIWASDIVMLNGPAMRTLVSHAPFHHADGDDTFEVVEHDLKILDNLGCAPVCAVYDNHPKNVYCVKRLVKQYPVENADESKERERYPIDGHNKTTFAKPDEDHTVKDLRDELVLTGEAGVEFPEFVNNDDEVELSAGVAKWTYVKNVYDQRESLVKHGFGLSIFSDTPSLCYDAVNPTGTMKMRVGLAIRPFKPDCTNAIRKLKTTKNDGGAMRVVQDKEAQSTANFMTIIYKWWTIVSNCRKVGMYKGKRKSEELILPFSRADDWRLEWLLSFADWIEKWYYEDEKRRKIFIRKRLVREREEKKAEKKATKRTREESAKLENDKKRMVVGAQGAQTKVVKGVRDHQIKSSKVKTSCKAKAKVVKAKTEKELKTNYEHDFDVAVSKCKDENVGCVWPSHMFFKLIAECAICIDNICNDNGMLKILVKRHEGITHRRVLQQLFDFVAGQFYEHIPSTNYIFKYVFSTCPECHFEWNRVLQRVVTCFTNIVLNNYSKVVTDVYTQKQAEKKDRNGHFIRNKDTLRLEMLGFHYLRRDSNSNTTPMFFPDGKKRKGYALRDDLQPAYGTFEMNEVNEKENRPMTNQNAKIDSSQSWVASNVPSTWLRNGKQHLSVVQ